ncbi:MAG: hypothetical protein JW726_14145 [Anaerolineales bacterium]|nr:hypothetical protein [Anaerolineales bacterium]
MQPKPPESHLPAALQTFETLLDGLEIVPEALKSGMLCPACGKGILDYDGLLNLACPICGFNSSGGAGCT